MKHLSVLMIYGGESSEHEISIRSARNVFNGLRQNKYIVHLCYIDREGRWWLLKDWSDQPEEETTSQLAILPGTAQLIQVNDGIKVEADIVFPVLHGKNGEDGTIQGLIEMLHVPVVGCGVEASAIGINKDTTKRLLQAYNIPVAPWIAVADDFDLENILEQVSELRSGGPWFVKPARAGSSVGVTKVHELTQLESAINSALLHDNLVLIEAAIVGRELEVAVLGNPPDHTASGIGEIIPGHEFYDYDDKYSPDSASRSVLDAGLGQGITEVIRKHALDAHRILGCKGLSRVDFLLSEDGIPYLNEINTMPGFTDISMFPKLWEAKGISQAELVERLIQLAVE